MKQGEPLMMIHYSDEKRSKKQWNISRLLTVWLPNAQILPPLWSSGLRKDFYRFNSTNKKASPLREAFFVPLVAGRKLRGFYTRPW